jgi:hypothetical protein
MPLEVAKVACLCRALFVLAGCIMYLSSQKCIFEDAMTGLFYNVNIKLMGLQEEIIHLDIIYSTMLE